MKSLCIGALLLVWMVAHADAGSTCSFEERGDDCEIVGPGNRSPNNCLTKFKIVTEGFGESFNAGPAVDDCKKNCLEGVDTCKQLCASMCGGLPRIATAIPANTCEICPRGDEVERCERFVDQKANECGQKCRNPPRFDQGTQLHRSQSFLRTGKLTFPGNCV